MGLIAGFIAGVAMDITEAAVYMTFRQPEYRSKDWVSLIVAGKRSATSSQSVFAEAGHLVLTTILGGAFAVLQPRTEKKPVLYGCTWAMGAFTVSQGLSKLLKLPLLSELGWRNRIQHLFLALVYGSVLGASLHLMQRNKSLWHTLWGKLYE